MPKQPWHITSINADNLKFDVDIIYTWQEGFVLLYFLLFQILMHVNICLSRAREHAHIAAEITTCTLLHQTSPPQRPFSISRDWDTAACNQTRGCAPHCKIWTTSSRTGQADRLWWNKGRRSNKWTASCWKEARCFNSSEAKFCGSWGVASCRRGQVCGVGNPTLHLIFPTVAPRHYMPPWPPSSVKRTVVSISSIDKSLQLMKIKTAKQTYWKLPRAPLLKGTVRKRAVTPKHPRRGGEVCSNAITKPVLKIPLQPSKLSPQRVRLNCLSVCLHQLAGPRLVLSKIRPSRTLEPVQMFLGCPSTSVC